MPPERRAWLRRLVRAELETIRTRKATLTINGVHLNELGNKKIGELIAQALLKKQIGATTAHEKLREAVLDKTVHWHNRYRATDGNDVWGDVQCAS